MGDYLIYIVQRLDLTSKNGKTVRQVFKVVPELEEIYHLKYGSWFYMEIPPRFRHPAFKTNEVTFQSRLESIKKRGVEITKEEWERLRTLDRI